jgi:hypothetical protein
VTTLDTTGVFMVPGNISPPVTALSIVVPRDASTVLCSQAPATMYRSGPPDRVVQPLGSENLGTSTKPFYHGGGLLPGALDRKTLVLTPGVFTSQVKWALRRLTYKEILVANDFGTVVTASITAGKLSDDSLRSLTPGKTLVSLVERWGCNGGGSFFKTGRAGGDLSSFEPPVKRSKLSTEAVAERCCGTEVMADEPKEDVDGSHETVLEDVAREN